ncbi:hypothetical protein A1Q2_06477 [Trichosporon asahii var. asahii CBS 8904]|uniref:Uncharacterized protein n=1 Tax=Trichosporon asahii var. asahii (strain CBS 8904) TaxID=1220162 RepID=K1VRD4_TRIAC|nr:hypothetical protein A1Q2_06477 [Trichosporon asahii var. asahii CBS 8904]
MFLDRFTFLHPLMVRSRRRPAPTTSGYVEDTEHEMSTLGAKRAPRPPLRSRLFSAASSMSARSARSARSAGSARSTEASPSIARTYGDYKKRGSFLSRHRLSEKRRSSQHLRSLKRAATITTEDKVSRTPPAKFKRRQVGRLPKIPPQPTTVQLSRGSERDELDAQAADLRRRIATQRRRLAADLADDLKPFPR